MALPGKLRSFLLQRVPIFQWAPNYDTHKLVSDLIAGITVGLTVMPQGLAYATLAGLEPQVCFFVFSYGEWSWVIILVSAFCRRLQEFM